MQLTQCYIPINQLLGSKPLSPNPPPIHGIILSCINKNDNSTEPKKRKRVLKCTSEDMYLINQDTNQCIFVIN